MRIFKLAWYAFFLGLWPTIVLADLVKPETTVAVELSSRDTNRFVCNQGPINDVFYSEEKGITVRVDGNNAFVKFLVKAKGAVKEYVSVPSEFYIVCAGQTYTVIGKPNSRISAKTYRLGDSFRERVNHLTDVFGPLSVEQRVVKATEMVYRGGEDMLRKVADNKTLKLRSNKIIPGAIVSSHQAYEVDGYGLVVREYRVKANDERVFLQEVQFLQPIFSKRILAITIIPHEISKGQVARVFIVEKEGSL